MLYLKITIKSYEVCFFSSHIPLLGKIAENTAISHNYILTNLSGVKKFQFRQEKQWQTRNTSRCRKCA